MVDPNAVAAKRKVLMIAYSARCGAPAACSAALVDQAVKRGYVAPREPVHGKTLHGWTHGKSVPEWACKAACDLLLADLFEPRTDLEWEAVAYYWQAGHGPFASEEDALGSFPGYLDRDQLRKFL